MGRRICTLFRPDFVKNHGIVFLLGITIYVFGNLAAQADPRPNIILCMADDLGWGDVGYNGNQVVKTPALDTMSREGIRFNRWYAASAVCSPTRGSCLTGRHPLRYGVLGANSGHLKREELSLSEALLQRGYTTGHFGKWHLGTLTTEIKDSNRGRPGKTNHFSPPWKNGFDVCFSTEAKVPTYDPMRKPKDHAGRFWQPVDKADADEYGTYYWNESGQIVTDNLAGDDSRVIMDRVIPFVENATTQRRPFFAVVWFHAPHLPVVAGPRHAALYKGREWREQMYYGCISALDQQIGRLRDALERNGIADNTMLWFCSDNGPENHTPGSAGPLRARKRSLHDGGVRVPGVMVWPKVVTTPRTIDAPCFTGDYFATILKSVDPSADIPNEVDGEDIMPIILGKETERNRPVFFRFGRQSAVVANRFKLYRGNRNQAWSLFDMQADLSESRDVAAAHPQIASELTNAYAQWESTLPPANQN